MPDNPAQDRQFFKNPVLAGFQTVKQFAEDFKTSHKYSNKQTPEQGMIRTLAKV